MEPFKENFNIDGIKRLAAAINDLGIDADPFFHAACDGLDDLELKERSAQISESLDLVMPDDFAKAASILCQCLSDGDWDNRDVTGLGDKGVSGWMSLPLTNYIARHGLAHREISFKALEKMTPHFSAEFDIRFFLIDDFDACRHLLESWTQHENHHIRRLVSEGTRPRLPWGIRLTAFIKDPLPILPFLESLKDDPEEYVRRSVANNLNDIAKDHPDLVANLMAEWVVDADKNRMKLIKHALRSLIKQGHQGALSVIGIHPPEISLSEISVTTPEIQFGEKVDFSITLNNDTSRDQDLVLDYVLHFVKANGKQAPKVFKWSNFTLKAGERKTLSRQHPVKPITTRKYYPGDQGISLQINGQPFGKASFLLHMDDKD